MFVADSFCHLVAMLPGNVATDFSWDNIALLLGLIVVAMLLSHRFANLSWHLMTIVARILVTLLTGNIMTNLLGNRTTNLS